ncbi:MAG: hypothetical protein M0C28_42200 [Candidatus Moduliflexus flocculans]|nr:hypothetical protein [Candidatus Moduliflexus flocculans]
MIHTKRTVRPPPSSPSAWAPACRRARRPRSPRARRRTPSPTSRPTPSSSRRSGPPPRRPWTRSSASSPRAPGSTTPASGPATPWRRPARRPETVFKCYQKFVERQPGERVGRRRQVQHDPAGPHPGQGRQARVRGRHRVATRTRPRTTSA